jgi:hypothetical protein
MAAVLAREASLYGLASPFVDSDDKSWKYSISFYIASSTFFFVRKPDSKVHWDSQISTMSLPLGRFLPEAKGKWIKSTLPGMAWYGKLLN